MAIRFRCDGCGKPFEVRDDLAGKTAECKACGGRIQIPDRPAEDEDIYGLDDPSSRPFAADPEFGSTTSGKGGWATRPISDPGPGGAFDPSYLQDSPKAAKKSGFSFLGSGGLKGGLGVLFMVALIGLKIYAKTHRGHRARNPQPQAARADLAPGPRIAIPLDGPIAVPSFPDAGPARPIAPGVTVREVDLGPPSDDPNAPPGHSGRLWVYLPEGDHPPRSLPCVLIAPAGSNLITGMKLADGDRPEHIPYAQAGFAVVAYELDGGLDDPDAAPAAEMQRAATRFLHARAGLVNAHVALEYALAKLPEVDPGRVVAVGHSSAGTMAVLFAEHEPRLRACVAFAPALDLADRFGRQGAAGLRRVGLGPLVDRFSPRVEMSSLGCPLFLFHARDDGNVPARQSENFAEGLKAQGRSAITLEVVPDGGHYESMIREGIPRAIEWLRKTTGPGPGADAPGPG